jgi:glucose-6-phosphate isomerase
MTISLDFTNMMADVIDGGSTESGLERTAQFIGPIVRDIYGDRQRFGFLDLPANAALHESSRRVAAATRGKIDDVVVLGIGGSALGPITIRTALCAPNWNMLSDAERGGSPRLHVLDNVDPRTILALLDRLVLDRSLFIVTSKSGGTAETMAQYLVVRDRLDRALGERARDHLVFITDSERGALRAIAGREGIVTLDIPPAVGGRFSVLSPVGMLPAALIGVDTAAMLAGAEAMRIRCEQPRLTENPAGLFAVLLGDATRDGADVHVLMPYADALRDLAAWFVQLWAESLGKQRASDGESVGPTPIVALGATDQHSQVQLFMEGPANKSVVFIAVRDRERDVEIPRLHGDVAIDRVDAWHLGGLFMLFEVATVIAGIHSGVNPLDQPGVELGKQFTYALLGRADADAARQEWESLPKPDPRRTV